MSQAKLAYGIGHRLITVGYKRNRQVFSDAQEAKLAGYLQNASAIYYGLTPTSVRKLAFECAVKFSISVPATWRVKQMAGVDWFCWFSKKKSQNNCAIPRIHKHSQSNKLQQT